MKNQYFTGTPTSRRFALCPSTVVAGDAVLLGTLPSVALDSYSSLTGGTTFLYNGTFTLTVIAKDSGGTNAAVNPGDPIYAHGGTLDAATNVTTGITLGAAGSPATGVVFGRLDPINATISSGSTSTTAEVQL